MLDFIKRDLENHLDIEHWKGEHISRICETLFGDCHHQSLNVGDEECVDCLYNKTIPDKWKQGGVPTNVEEIYEDLITIVFLE